MGESRLPGPVCATLKDWGLIDDGTTCRSASSAPGPTRAKPKPLTPQVEQIIKDNYLRHAREVSYVMQGQSMKDGALRLLDQALEAADLAEPKKKPRRVNSFLGGAFLRMYLDGKLDPDVVEDAGEQIAESPAFQQLEEQSAKSVEWMINNNFRRTPTEEEFVAQFDKLLKWRKEKKGIAFRGELNTVVGGVTDVEVVSGQFLKVEEVEGGTRIEYEVQVKFSDTYDFSNKRSGEYDAYRKRLANLLQRNEFGEFEKAYLGEVQPFKKEWRKTKLDNAAIFASYMYALEMRGWTPGPLPWSVVIPMRGTVVHRKKHGSPKKRKK